MSEPVVHDLDVLRPKPEYVLLGGKKIDVSFIPSGVALDIMGLQQELVALTDTPEKVKKVEAGGEEARKSFEIAATLCSSITAQQYPEMDKEWLLKNTDVAQIKVLMEYIVNAVFSSMAGVEDKETKKPSAAGKKKSQ